MNELSWATARYRVAVDPRRLVATVTGADGRRWAALRLLSSVDCLDGPDETVGQPRLDCRRSGDGYTVTVEADSSRWHRRVTRLRCTAAEATVDTTVTGTGAPTAVHLLGGWRTPAGFLPSGSSLGTVVSPNPDHPSRLARPAVEPATIGVVGDGAEPGVGRWLFTPAPWCLAAAREPAAAPDRPPAGEWLGIGLAVPGDEQHFTQWHYQPVTDGFSLRLDYEGQTPVTGAFRTPTVLLRFGASDPYQVFADHRAALAGRGLVPARSAAPVPAWWREPIFCGWGAECQEAARTGTVAAAGSSRGNYDRYLAVLARHGVKPGTITVDDKWQRAYAGAEPDPVRWPDLAGWIAARHARGQRVLLWWKAWDPEGAPAELCVRDARGTPVALDPTNPDCRRHLARTVAAMLGPGGLDADGLKIDFTAGTPSGASLARHGSRWGASLLHLLLATVYRAAKEAKPDALIVTHTPNPAFTDVTDMIRLNDARMLDAPDPRTDVVAHLTYRARVVAASCPGLLVDTDGWSMPDRAQWRAYLAAQPALGVPSLYYADSVGDRDERLVPDDYRAVRDTWSAYRATVAKG